VRIFLFAAIACAVLALICVVAPTTIAIGALGWLIAGFLAFLLDIAFGGVNVGPRNPQ
jgi:hypothetical protein